METTNHWVSVWGNAVSVAENRPERYAKDITLRYPIHIPFSGHALRLTFDNYSPVFLPGESQGQGSLVGCRLWGRTESDMTEVT